MIYVHIPVQFAMPTEADLLAFFDAMDVCEDTRIPDCAANYNIRAFLGCIASPWLVFRQAFDRAVETQMKVGELCCRCWRNIAVPDEMARCARLFAQLPVWVKTSIMRT